jgi:hypothetical protein
MDKKVATTKSITTEATEDTELNDQTNVILRVLGVLRGEYLAFISAR